MAIEDLKAHLNELKLELGNSGQKVDLSNPGSPKFTLDNVPAAKKGDASLLSREMQDVLKKIDDAKIEDEKKTEARAQEEKDLEEQGKQLAKAEKLTAEKATTTESYLERLKNSGYQVASTTMLSLGCKLTQYANENGSASLGPCSSKLSAVYQMVSPELDAKDISSVSQISAAAADKADSKLCTDVCAATKGEIKDFSLKTYEKYDIGKIHELAAKLDEYRKNPAAEQVVSATKLPKPDKTAEASVPGL